MNKNLILIIILFIVCIGVFLYQYNNDVTTFIVFNETEVSENGTITGMLLDSYGNGVANKTVTYQNPNHDVKSVVSDKEGVFTIKNAQKLSNGDYRNFTFLGDDKYIGCSYEGNIKVV